MGKLNLFVRFNLDLLKAYFLKYVNKRISQGCLGSLL